MRSYHIYAPDSRRKHGQSLHSHEAPKLQFSVKGVRWLLLTDEHGRQFRAPLDAFWKSPSFELDRGFGVQRALPLDAMSDTATPQQQSLFEVTT